MVDRYIEVRTQIPERLLSRYHQVVADLLREQPSPSDRPALSPTDRANVPHSWTEPEIEREITLVMDGEGSIDPPFESVPSASSDAFNLYLQLSPRALETCQYLVDRPGRRVSGDELAQVLGVSAAELTGSLSSIRKRCDAMNRPMPLRYRPGSKGGTYSMDWGVADVFRKAQGDMRWGGPDEEGAEVLTEMIENTWELLNLVPKRQEVRAQLRLLDDAGADEVYRQEVQRQLDASDERVGQLAKRRAALLRKYDVEDIALMEDLHIAQTQSAAQQEVPMTQDQ